MYYVFVYVCDDMNLTCYRSCVSIWTCLSEDVTRSLGVLSVGKCFITSQILTFLNIVVSLSFGLRSSLATAEYYSQCVSISNYLMRASAFSYHCILYFGVTQFVADMILLLLAIFILILKNVLIIWLIVYLHFSNIEAILIKLWT